MFWATACHGICSNKQLIILEMSAYKILSGQLTLSIELIKPNDLVILTHWFSTTVVLKNYPFIKVQNILAQSQTN